ncbi:RsmD family RNA methyltransferase [Streptomyces sp. CSDS2]|uniref:RsmD family RNA methyltransferase n=1 Tax=Streptomyces sp. CSDS2 TaxID=3055051 RepID=UPI0025AEE897|nr:RsmD family RNA methyltransferase [Streptomyces sp. CSDS2]MDN3261945.1 RsmD family RNA methyltransferase [Streptomyces sp. CSDS2]
MPHASDSHAAYFAFRALLLGELRTTVLTGEQLCEAGRLIYGRPEGLSLYGIPATGMEAAGIRLLGRTTIECCVDEYAAAVAEALTALHATVADGGGDTGEPLVLDLFCGSGNFSHHLATRLGVTVHAAELDPAVHDATAHNLTRVDTRTRLYLSDYRDLLGKHPARGPRDTYFVEPPWGPAFTPAGLDLTRTSPPVPEILDDIRHARAGMPCLVAIKTNDHIAHDSLAHSFAGHRHLRTITPAATLPHGANMDFHIFRLDGD